MHAPSQLFPPSAVNVEASAVKTQARMHLSYAGPSLFSTQAVTSEQQLLAMHSLQLLLEFPSALHAPESKADPLEAEPPQPAVAQAITTASAPFRPILAD